MSRFNLRSRTSLKLSSQTQCERCQRQFFTRDDDDSDNENKALCNNCDALSLMNTKKSNKDKPKPPNTPAKRIKLEKTDPVYRVNDDNSQIHTLQNTVIANGKTKQQQTLDRNYF